MVLARCEDSAVCVMCSASGLREVSPRKPCWSRVFTVRKVFARKRGVEGYSKQNRICRGREGHLGLAVWGQLSCLAPWRPMIFPTLHWSG